MSSQDNEHDMTNVIAMIFSPVVERVCLRRVGHQHYGRLTTIYYNNKLIIVF